MRILCIIDGLGPGGAQRQLVNLAKLLMQNGEEVHFAWYCDADFFRTFLDENRIPYTKIHAGGRFSKILGVAKLIHAFRPHTVISYIDGPNVICSMLKIIGMRFNLIVSERNTNFTVNNYVKQRFFFYRFADYIVPNSYGQKDFIDKNFPKLASKTHTITNFTDTQFYTPSIKYSPSDMGEMRLLVVASVGSQKNTLKFIEAISIVKHRGVKIKVKWVGKATDTDYEKKCLESIARNNLSSDFEFTGLQTNVLKYYQEAEVFCLPSIREGFPNAISEAMCCGLPVLCSNICDNPRIVSDGENGFLFDPSNEEDIADKIEAFGNLSGQQKEEMRHNSRTLAERYFSPNNFINNYYELIKK